MTMFLWAYKSINNKKSENKIIEKDSATDCYLLAAISLSDETAKNRKKT